MQTLKPASLRKYIPSAAAALLFTALLAQAPHAATVFIRIAPQDVEWEVWWIAIVGGVVYAIALESATAYFVWRNKMRWAIAFAAFSIMHNVAYYMPGAWTFDVAGAQLSLRYIVSALLISASLPIAIAAFSHVHVESQAKHDDKGDEGDEEENPAKPATTNTQPVELAKARSGVPTGTLGHSSETPPDATPAETGDLPATPAEQPQDVPTHDTRTQALQLRDEGYTPAEIARMTGAKYSTVQSWLRRATTQTNGVHQ